MTPDGFKTRTKAFALRSIRLVEALPASTTGQVLGRQLLRCATSVGANYRSACRAKSRADFIAKMRIVEEECDEAVWVENPPLVKGERGGLPRFARNDRWSVYSSVGISFIAFVKASMNFFFFMAKPMRLILLPWT